MNLSSSSTSSATANSGQSTISQNVQANKPAKIDNRRHSSYNPDKEVFPYIMNKVKFPVEGAEARWRTYDELDQMAKSMRFNESFMHGKTSEEIFDLGLKTFIEQIRLSPSNAEYWKQPKLYSSHISSKYKAGDELQVGETVESMSKRNSTRFTSWRKDNIKTQDPKLEEKVRENNNKFHQTFMCFDSTRSKKDDSKVYTTKDLLVAVETCVFKYFTINYGDEELLLNTDTNGNLKAKDIVGNDWLQFCVGRFVVQQLFGAGDGYVVLKELFNKADKLAYATWLYFRCELCRNSADEFTNYFKSSTELKKHYDDEHRAVANKPPIKSIKCPDCNKMWTFESQQGFLNHARKYHFEKLNSYTNPSISN